MITKEEMIQALINSPAWDGADAETLRSLPKGEIREAYEYIDIAEAEYQDD